MGGRPIVGLRAERSDDSLGVTVDDGQQHASRPIGHTTSLFPVLQGACVKSEAIRELLSTQPQPFAKGDNPPGSRIVDESAGKARLAANMGENFTQSRFNLASEPASCASHCPVLSFLISATRRESTLTSAGCGIAAAQARHLAVSVSAKASDIGTMNIVSS